MPTVRLYPGQRVAEQPLQTRGLSPDAPIEAFGGGTNQSSRILGEVYQQEKRKADDIAIMKADGELSKFEVSLLHDPEKGLVNRRGQSAFSAPDDFNKEYDRRVGEIRESLNNDEQRSAFDRLVVARRRSADSAIQSHVSRERRLYDDSETDGYVETERNAAAANPTDQARIDASFLRQKEAIVRWAARNSVPDVVVKQKMELEFSRTHQAVIQRLIAQGADLRAKEYFDANKEEIKDAKAVSDIENSLKESSIRGESQRQTDAIIAEFGTDREGGMKKARTIKDPVVRAATEQLVSQRYAELRSMETEAAGARFLEATNIVEQTKDIRKIDPNVWAKLPLDQRNALEQRAKHLREGTDVKNNDNKWITFMATSTSSLSQMSEAELRSGYLPHFDKAHRERALQMWREARESVSRGEAKSPQLSATLTYKDRVMNTLRTAGLVKEGGDPSTKSERERRFAVVEQVAARDIEQYELTELKGQRKATGEEQQRFIDRALINKVFINEWGTDPQVPAVLVSESDRKRVYVPFDQIPQSSVQKAVNLARSVGAIGQNVPADVATRRIRSRIEKAYAASLTGAPDAEVISILKGE